MGLIVRKKWIELADVKDELTVRDWFMASRGNLAIRVTEEPLEFLVTAKGKDKKKRTDEDFVLVDEQGIPIEATHLEPSAETMLHVEIFKKTKAGCSLHVHTVDNNVISELYGEKGKVTIKSQELIKVFEHQNDKEVLTIPIIANDSDIHALAKSFTEFVNCDLGAVLIRNHGIMVWGRTSYEAVQLLETSEFLFRYQLRLLELKLD